MSNMVKMIKTTLLTVLAVASFIANTAAFAGIKDTQIDVSIRSDDNDSLGLVFRYVDEQNYYRFFVDSQSSLRRLDKVVNGVTTIMAQDSFAYAKYATYDISIKAENSQLTVKMSGATVFSVEDSTFGEGGVALYSFANVGSFFYDIVVTNLRNGQTVFDILQDNQKVSEDLTIIDQGTISAPSKWVIATDYIYQVSNIYTSGDALNRRGTMMVLDATMHTVPFDTYIVEPAKSDWTVNSNAFGQQDTPFVVSNDAGQYAIAWEDESLGNPNVMYSLYEADGTPLVQDKRINLVQAGSHYKPVLALQNDGSVFAFWQEDGDNNHYYNIRASKFDINGNQIHPEFTIHTEIAGQQVNPAIATNDNGQIAVAWEDDDLGNDNINYRVFDADGNPLTDVIQVNDQTQGSHLAPKLLLRNDGSVIATWQDDADGNNYYNIRARGFDNSGVQIIAPIQVNPDYDGHQYRPSIAPLPNNGFVIAYEDDVDKNKIFDIRLRGFDQNGAEVFPDQQLNSESPKNQSMVALATLANGNFLATWVQEDTLVKARLFDATGKALINDIIWLNDSTGVQQLPALVELSGNKVLTAWQDDKDQNGFFEIIANVNTLLLDEDGDRVANIYDAFPTDPSETIDTDGDGIGNVADIDDDNDGIDDEWELANGLDPLVNDAQGDLDGDGATNAQEYADNTSANDNESCNTGCFPLIRAFATDVFELEMGEQANITWDVIRADTIDITYIGSGMASNGSQLVGPSNTVVYTLTAVNPYKTVSKNVTVEVYTAVSESTYNAMGQRTVHQENGQTKIAIYGPSGELLAELDPSGDVTKEYVYLGSAPLAQVNNPNTAQQEIFYVHTDHLGTPKMMTDKDQNVAWQIETMPFGEPMSETGIEQKQRFPGQYDDGETGFSYNYYRYYDPQTGRYITSDPIGLYGGMNTYAYVGMNPVGRFDYYGLDWIDDAGNFAAGFGDTISFGATKWVRQQLGSDNTVDSCSGFYSAGEWTGIGYDVVAGGAGIVKAVGKTTAKRVTKGENLVYQSIKADGKVDYVGITNNLERRAAEHLGQKGISIDAIPGLSNLSRADARAVEQVLIETHGLGKNGGTLLNKINSISQTNSVYAESLTRGAELLKNAGYPGF